MVTAYLAGPDVFLPNARAHAAAKVAICRRHGIEALAPVGDAIDAALLLPPNAAWRTIHAINLATMERATICIANLTPFRGASADAGTLVELGWFAGRGKAVFGYSNDATPFERRSAAQLAAVPDAVPGTALEGFGLADNLMVPGALLPGGLPLFVPEAPVAWDSLAVFERCVAAVARVLAAPG